LKELERLVLQAASDEQVLDRLIEENRAFILKCAGSAAHRYITESDDEWSLALYAFTEAVKEYDSDKGGFLRFAELVIRRRLTDYYRSQSKYRQEIPVNPSVFTGEASGNEHDAPDPVRLSVIENSSVKSDNSIKYEIEAANQVFSKYGFTFFDLASCSPKSKKTKESCAKAVAYIIKNPAILEELRNSRMLPIKSVEKNAKVPRKIIERHRKYIIAAVEILSGDYPHLAEYMQFIRKELSGA